MPPRHADPAPGGAWLTAAALVALAVALAAIGNWLLHNPHIAGWDELGYVNRVQRDFNALANGGWGAFRDSVLLDDRWQPPLVRIIAIPWGLVVGLGQTSLRILGALCWLFSLPFLWWGARVAGDARTAWAAVAFWVLAPVSLMAGQEFMSETALLPAGAIYLCFLLRAAILPVVGWPNAVMLGLGLGAGLAAKFSFMAMAGPSFGAVMLAALLGRLPPGRLGHMVQALLVAALVAWPLYLFNGARYLSYAQLAAVDWTAHGLLHDGPIDFIVQWVRLQAEWVVGPLLLLAFALAGLTALLALPRGRAAGGGTARLAPPLIGIGLCLLVVGPLLGAHLIGQNQNPRLLAPAMVPLAVLFALLLHLAASRLLNILVALLLVGQAAGIAAFIPLRDEWAGPDITRGLAAISGRYNPMCRYDPVMERLDALGLTAPRIAQVGGDFGFNHVQIAYPWYRAGRSVTVLPLHETLPPEPDWPRVMDTLASQDAVLVLDVESPPRRERKVFPPELPNRFNASVLAHMATDGRFRDQGPIVLGAVPPCRVRLFLTVR